MMTRLVVILLLILTLVPQVRAQSKPEFLFRVLEPTEAYTDAGELAFVASPGEWYFVLSEEAGWLLAVWEFDEPANAVWISRDARIELAHALLPPDLESETALSPVAQSDATPVLTPTAPTFSLTPTLPPANQTAAAVQTQVAAPQLTPQSVTPNVPIVTFFDPPPPRALTVTPTPILVGVHYSCRTRELTVPQRIRAGDDQPFRAAGFKPGTLVDIDVIEEPDSLLVPSWALVDERCEVNGMVRTLSSDRPGRYTLRVRGEGFYGGGAQASAIFEFYSAR